MARRTRNPKPPVDLSSFRSVYLDFTDQERNEITSILDGIDFDLASLMDENTTDGWKVSFSYSSGWDNYVLSLTPKTVLDFPSNIVYIFRHRDFNRVLQVLYFFFTVMVKNSDARLSSGSEGNDW